MNDEELFNLTNSTSYSLPFNEIEAAISATLIISFLVVGVIGNGLTIAVIITYPNLHKNIFLNFILSLCFSDLISALISWLFLYRRTWGFNYWYLPEFFCKIYWAFDIFTSFVTASHILSFSLLRLLSIQKTSFFRKIRLSHGRIWIFLLWLICLLCGLLPSLFIFGSSGKAPDREAAIQNARWPACTILREMINIYRHFATIAFPIFLYVPMIGVFIICIVIVWVVYSRAKLPINAGKSRPGKEKQAVLQLLLIIASFFIGYIPFTAYEFWSLQEHPNTSFIHRTDYWFGMIEYLFLRFSECLNPFFYNFGSAKVRYHTKKFVIEKLLCKQRKLKKGNALKRRTLTTTVAFPKAEAIYKEKQVDNKSNSANSIALM